jgi:5'-phosphate synthase pdxT subunit
VKIGVLSLQGDFAEHVAALREAGAEAAPVKKPEDVLACAGLVIPGGESTTIGKLCQRFGVGEAIHELAARGAPIWGTCAGMILLAKEIHESDQWRLGLMDIAVRRNAFGRQVDSFETDVEITGIAGGPVRAVFIRAPYVTRVFGPAKPLATVQDKIIAARQGQFLATAFHPELTADRRVQEYFVRMVREQKS